MAEKFSVAGIELFVTILVARYLGPEKYGILAFAISMKTLFATASHMGLVGLTTREIIKYPEKKIELLGTVFTLKLLGSIVGFVVLFLYALVFEKHKSIEFWVLLIVSVSIFFKSFDVIDFWFQAHTKAMYNTIARLASSIIAALMKLLLVLAGSGLLFFALTYLLQSLLIACFLLLLFYLTTKISITDFRFNFIKAKELFGQGWVIFLAAIFATIYLKIDQVMLRWFISQQEVGIYAAAVTLSEAWYFIPTSIVVSFFPKLIRLKETQPQKYMKRLQQILDILFSIALFFAIIITFIATPLVEILFGEKYISSAPILTIHIWAALFVFMRAAFSKWILIENVLVFSLITQGLGALVNVGLNIIVIPRYGGYGAAITTLISYAVASYFSLFFYSKTRPVFWMMTKSILSPIRYALLHRVRDL
jgi:O-antigen/teichoic acid export membrane protein